MLESRDDQSSRLKGNKGENQYLNHVFIGKTQNIFRNCVLYPDKVIFEISPLKVGIRSLGWDHRGSNPDTRSVKRTSEICGQHNKRSKIICGAVHNVLSSFLHYSTSGLAGGLFCFLQSIGMIRCSLDSLRKLGYCQHCLPSIR